MTRGSPRCSCVPEQGRGPPKLLMPRQLGSHAPAPSVLILER